ncbi:MAG: hypothetical protein OXN21_01895 [Chloroflexota bacterium]|nr:hypothetical protein [Chloroflexota bacterium]
MLEGILTTVCALALYEAGKQGVRHWHKQRRHRAYSVIIPD